MVGKITNYQCGERDFAKGGGSSYSCLCNVSASNTKSSLQMYDGCYITIFGGVVMKTPRKCISLHGGSLLPEKRKVVWVLEIFILLILLC